MKYIFTILFFLMCFGSKQLLAQEAMPVLPKDFSEQEGKRYEREKSAWIKRNPQAYQDLSKKSHRKKKISTTRWIFSDATVIENEIIKNIPSPTQQQVIHDFSSQNLTIKVIDNKHFYFYSNKGNTKIFEGELKAGSIVENHKDCPKCGSIDFDFEEFGQEHIIVKQEHEPKGSKPFVVQYNFVRK
jgi:hypothetical protein